MLNKRDLFMIPECTDLGNPIDKKKWDIEQLETKLNYSVESLKKIKQYQMELKNNVSFIEQRIIVETQQLEKLKQESDKDKKNSITKQRGYIQRLEKKAQTYNIKLVELSLTQEEIQKKQDGYIIEKEFLKGELALLESRTPEEIIEKKDSPKKKSFSIKRFFQPLRPKTPPPRGQKTKPTFFQSSDSKQEKSSIDTTSQTPDDLKTESTKKRLPRSQSMPLNQSGL